MIVKDLIAKLQALPPEADINLCVEDGDYYDIEGVVIDEDVDEETYVILGGAYLDSGE